MSEQRSANNTIARERVDNLATCNSEPDWLRQLRLAAWEDYLQLPMPTARTEEWKSTKIDALDLSALKAVDLGAAGGEETPAWAMTALSHLGKTAATISVAGILGDDLPQSLAKQGVIFCSLQHALTHHADLLRPYLSCSRETAEKDKFGLMNQALFNGGMFLYVPAKVEVEEPFVALINSSAENQTAVFPRLVVVLEGQARARLVTLFCNRGTTTKGGSYALSNSSVEIHIGQGAKLDYLEVQRFNDNVFSVSSNHNSIGRDGTFNSLTVALGGGQLKGEIATALKAPGAASEVQGLVLGGRSEHFSFNTIQQHDAPDTKSDITFRVALKHDAASIYQGIIRVGKVAQRTDAYQSNKNLLLGSRARADSIPRLEILADDVKCSHGATVGPVDREQIFYLMTRGLNEAEAEELIVSGFFKQVLDTCTVSGAAEMVGALLSEKLTEGEKAGQ